MPKFSQFTFGLLLTADMPDSPNNEEELLRQLRIGNKAAFTELYNLHSQSLYLNLLKLVKVEALAEEILQEIFLTLWEKREVINIEYSLKFYLFRIGENKVHDFFRKLKRDRKLHEHIREVSTSEYAILDNEILHDQESALLNKAIEMLSPQRKQVFRLCKLEGKSYQEVSRLLGISTSTVNDYIVKATRFIRDYILSNDARTDITIGICFILYG